jgi:hypothetical protein
MIDAAPQVKEKCRANLEALHKQLEELAARSKRPGSERESHQDLQGPVLVIQGSDGYSSTIENVMGWPTR